MEKNKKNRANSSINEFKLNIKNPFLEDAVEQINSKIVKKYKTATKTGEKAILKAIDENTGEILGHTQFIRQIEVDEEQFTKIYLSNFSAFFDLKPQALKVFGYILTQLVPNKDGFYFFSDECQEYTGYKSKTSIRIGLTSLLENKIIARGRNDVAYFVNPMVAFNGNRITFAKTYVKKQESKNKEISSQTNILNQIKDLEKQ
ncbi:replication/maintenance protein RepL [Tenacibaculum dicentrarchi]|uniref:replication/maintenance protein RepL n=1 Tax=Tenacibaculum finnmarkense TaxID=2781243 RepID=UPI001E4581EE|nr:replication/maintenance protein RepL [Tenacibaculum finnmarkense]MCD8401382.1 replication/maintenance protein RepL [Tenacibaculum finnmarkense genomovar ulcerans]MCD8408604.1 replication/maintenance protein RepL [Tenacibaculum dicentrarchi]